MYTYTRMYLIRQNVYLCVPGGRFVRAEQRVHFRCSLRANKHARHMAQKFLIGESCNAVHCIYALDKPQVSRIHRNSETAICAFH